MTTKLILIALAVTLLFAGGYYVHTLMAENQELRGELKIAKMQDSLNVKEFPRMVKLALDSVKLKEDSTKIADYRNQYNDAENQMKNIQPNFIKTYNNIKKYTPAQNDAEYNKGVAEMNGEIGK